MSFPFGVGDRESQFRTRHTGDDSLFTAFNLSSPPNSNRVSLDSSNDARATLQRRFTTANVPSATQGVSWFGSSQQRRQEPDAQNGDMLRVTPSNTLLEKKQKELELARAQRKQVDDYLMRLEEDMKTLSTGMGNQSEPTTPPELQESGFPTMFSRPSRFSASSVTSPPGLTSRSNRTSTLISSPEHERNRALEALTGGQQETSEENGWNAPQRSIGILNRNSMPVTRRDLGNRNGITDYSSLGPVNTSSFLFDDEDNSSTLDHEKTPTSRNAATFPIMSKNSDGFPVLLSNNGRMSYTGGNGSELNSATSDNSLDDGGWPSFRNSSSDSPPFGLPHPNSSSGQVTPKKGSISERHSAGGRIGTLPESQRSSYVTTTSEGSNPGSAAGSTSLPTPPRLQNSLSASSVPTLKTNTSSSGGYPQNIMTPEQKFHNHNVSLGRIPPGAVGTSTGSRHSREMTGNENRIEDQLSPTGGQMVMPQLPQQANVQQAHTNPPAHGTMSSPGEQEPTVAFQQPGGNPYTPSYGSQNAMQNFMTQFSTMNLNQSMPWANGMQMYGQQQYTGYNPYQQFGSARPRTAQPGGTPSKRNQPSDHITDITQLPLDRIRNNILELCKDQHGCRFLQKKLDEGKSESIEIIFDETSAHIAELMVDGFGNYLVQKLLERATSEQRTVLINNAAPSMVNIALNTHGTRALQKMLEYVESREQIDTVVRALQDQVVRMIQDLNGNHVVQKCLNRLSREDAQFIFDKVAADCVAVGTHRHGCCVIQRCIDHASGAQKVQLVTALTQNALPLVQDPFGNYVLQYVLDQNEPHLSEPLCNTFLGHIAELSRQKFSSNVVEKAIRVAETETKHKMVEEIIESPEFDRIADDQYANYVVQTAWDEATDEKRTRMAERLRPLVPRIRHKAHGRRYQSKIQEFENRMGIPSSAAITPQSSAPSSTHDINSPPSLTPPTAAPMTYAGGNGTPFRNMGGHENFANMGSGFNGMPPNPFGGSAFAAPQYNGGSMFGSAQPRFQNAMPPNPMNQFQQQQMPQQYSAFGRPQQHGNGYF